MIKVFHYIQFYIHFKQINIYCSCFYVYSLYNTFKGYKILKISHICRYNTTANVGSNRSQSPVVEVQQGNLKSHTISKYTTTPEHIIVIIKNNHIELFFNRLCFFFLMVRTQNEKN